MTTPPGPILPAVLPAELASVFQQKIDDLSPKLFADREALVAKYAGTIVIPRMHVSNVAYEPLPAEAGRPAGMRVTYNVTFSETGDYDPQLRVFAEDPSDSIVGRKDLNVRHATIAPAPRLRHSPSQYADTFRVNMSQWTDFLYEAGTVYTFMVELVPNFWRWSEAARIRRRSERRSLRPQPLVTCAAPGYAPGGSSVSP